MSDTRFFLKKAASGSEVEIKGELTVGRSPDSGLKLTEGNPSRHHARLTLQTDGVFIEDLKSVNGTYVNGTRVEQKTRIFPKDKIRFDIEEYVLRVEAPPPPPDADATKMRSEPAVAEAAKAEPGWIRGGNDSGVAKTVFKSAEELQREREKAAELRKSEAQAGPVTVPQLRIYEGGQPRTIQLLTSDPSKGEWSVGCDEGREVRIVREGVSGLHAKIINAGKVWKVVDQVAANGTFVNGERVTVRYLHSGDRIDFGPVECVFEAPGLKPAAKAAGSSPGSADADGARRKRGLLIAGLSFLATLIVLLILLKWFT